MIGTKKWKAKNRVKVALSTANPPHSQLTMSAPTYGMAENRLVITVAPQKDICPQGKTYPKKAAAITSNRSTTPTPQVSLWRYDPKNIPRATWAYKHKKKALAPLACAIRSNQPWLTSRPMCLTA